MALMGSPRRHAMAAKATAPKPATTSQTRALAIFMVGYSASKNTKTTTTKDKGGEWSYLFLTFVSFVLETFSRPQLIQPAGVQMNMVRRITNLGIAAIFVGLLGLSGARAQSADEADSLPAVRITHGPVVESVTETTAIIAWSTN